MLGIYGPGSVEAQSLSHFLVSFSQCGPALTKIVQIQTVRSRVDQVLLDHQVDDVLVLVSALCDNGLVLRKSNSHDTCGYVSRPGCVRHGKVVDGDVCHGQGIADIVAFDAGAWGTVSDEKFAFGNDLYRVGV